MTGDAAWVIIRILTLAVNLTSVFLMLPSRYKWFHYVVACALYTAAYFAVLPFLHFLDALDVTIRGLIYLPLVVFLLRGLFFQKIFAFFLAYLLTVFQATFAQILADALIHTESSAYPFVWLAIVLCMYAGYVFLLFRFGRKFFQKLFVGGRRSEWALYAFGGTLSFAVLTTIRLVQVDERLNMLLLLFTFWSSVVLCFAIINTHEKSKKSYEVDFAQSIISTGREHYQKMNELYDTILILRHDYKYHLSTINELAQNGDTDEIKKYLDSVQSRLPENDLRYYCSNSVINALLANYAKHCEEEGIRFDAQLAMPETLSIPNYDMCIVLVNLLENAVEACIKKESGRRIELLIKTQGSHLALIIKNSYGSAIVENEGFSKSVKKDGGFDLRSVQAVAACYDGHILTEWDGDMFTAYILLRV